jgi:hypothetical protein
VRRKKGESVTLYCTHCTWSTELSLAETEHSVVVTCSHCGASIYWHACASCGLKYAGEQAPRCPVCDADGSLEDITFD